MPTSSGREGISRCLWGRGGGGVRGGGESGVGRLGTVWAGKLGADGKVLIKERVHEGRCCVCVCVCKCIYSCLT